MLIRNVSKNGVLAELKQESTSKAESRLQEESLKSISSETVHERNVA